MTLLEYLNITLPENGALWWIRLLLSYSLLIVDWLIKRECQSIMLAYRWFIYMWYMYWLHYSSMYYSYHSANDPTVCMYGSRCDLTTYMAIQKRDLTDDDDLDDWCIPYYIDQRLMQNLPSQSNMELKGEQLFSKFQNAAFPIHPLANLRPSRKPLPTTGHFRFELATFLDKNHHVYCQTSPVPIISYGRISPPLAINPHGDKPAWR